MSLNRGVTAKIYKVKGGNLERQEIWNSQAKSSVNHKLHPLFLVCIVPINREFGSSKNGWATQPQQKLLALFQITIVFQITPLYLTVSMVVQSNLQFLLYLSLHNINVLPSLGIALASHRVFVLFVQCIYTGGR